MNYIRTLFLPENSSVLLPKITPPSGFSVIVPQAEIRNLVKMKYHGTSNLKKEILRFLADLDSLDEQPVYLSPILIKHNLEVRGIRERSYTAYSHQLLELEQEELVTRRRGSGANYCISGAGKDLVEVIRSR